MLHDRSVDQDAEHRKFSASSYCLFQEPWWLDAVAPGRWSEAVVRKGAETVARMPYVISKRHGVTRITLPSLTPTLGPWFRSTGAKSANRLRAEKDSIEQLLSQLPQHLHCSINCHPEIANVLPFHWAGFDLSVRYTYRIPELTDLDGIWKGFSENIRGDIRKAKKRVGIEYNLGTAKFLETYAKTFQRQGLKMPISHEFLEGVDEVLCHRQQRSQLFAVDGDGRVHAAIYMVWDHRCAYYLLGGGDPQLRSSGATSLLLWTALQNAATLTQAFDFEGSMIEPVERFFRAFGAVQTPYFRVSRTNSRLLRMALAWKGKAA